jgi:hypothetical protein
MKVRAAACGLVIAVSVAGLAYAQTPQVLPPRAPTIADAKPDAQGVRRMAVFRGLDKITGRARDVNAPVGVPVKFGTLTLTVQTCHTVPPEEPPETTAFVQIDEDLPGAKPKRMFSGWMFASTPALNALEHPTYDVWVTNCKTDEPAPAPKTTALAAPKTPTPAAPKTAAPAAPKAPSGESPAAPPRPAPADAAPADAANPPPPPEDPQP